MGSAFDVDSKLYRIVGKSIDLVKLNLLWIICSLPIVTVGASTSALLYVTGKMAKGEDGYAARDFLQQVKQNVGISMKYWIPTIVIYSVIWLDFMFWKSMLLTQNTLALVMLTFTVVLAYVFSMVLIYVLGLLGVHDNCNSGIWKTAALLAMKHLPKSFMMVLWAILAVIISKIWAIGLLLMILIGVSGVAYLQAHILKGIINQTTS